MIRPIEIHIIYEFLRVYWLGMTIYNLIKLCAISKNIKIKILTNISQKDLNFLCEEISLTDYLIKRKAMFHQYNINIIKKLRFKMTTIFLVVSEESKPSRKASYFFEIPNNKWLGADLGVTIPGNKVFNCDSVNILFLWPSQLYLA